jgi:outer membrane lipoprotein-sorting protein
MEIYFQDTYMCRTPLKYIGLMIFLFIILVPAQSAFCADEKELSIEAIIKKVDELYRSKTSFAELKMAISTPDWERTLTMKAWSEGMDNTFIYIMSPKKDEGIATLRIRNEMWNFFPKINKVMKVPPSMMMGQWMGSDFTNDDLVKESTLLDDYTAELFVPADANPKYFYINLKPKKTTITVWGKIELVVDKESYLPVTEGYYDENDNKIRVLTFKDIKDFGGRKLPSVLEMTPVKKQGHKTTIFYEQAEFDKELPSDTFTLRNLQKRR